MRGQMPYYQGQFTVTEDLLQVTIPRAEILAEMAQRGEQETLNDLCLAVAVVADLLAEANLGKLPSSGGQNLPHR